VIDQLKSDLRDPWWRINNLYYIINDRGKKILFEPKNRPVQRELFHNIHGRDVILKSRQHGVSTFFCIWFLDDCLFIPNLNAAIIAHKIDAAKDFLVNKIKYAYDNIRIPQLKELIPLGDDSKSAISFGNGSRITVSTSARCGTVQRLLISEYGKISATRPDKAIEIKTGSFPAVPHSVGRIAVESTAEGADGEFYNLCDKAFKTTGDLTPMDFKPHFFAWYQKPECKLSDDVLIPAELREYFKELDLKHGIVLDKEQKNWYTKEYEVQQDEMKREYPSTRFEAFEASVIGAFYQKQMLKLRNDKRLDNVVYDPEAYTYTAWDLGLRKSDSMVIVYFQLVGDKINVIDYTEDYDQDITHYIDILNGKGYRYKTHFAPHDINKRDLLTNKTRLQRAEEDYGLVFQHIPISQSVIEDINFVRRNFYRVRINQENGGRLIACLDNYRKEWDVKNGIFKEKPLHNEYSNGADGFRIMMLSLDYIDTPKFFDKQQTEWTFNGNQSNAWMI